jgi:hypothetical protein
MIGLRTLTEKDASRPIFDVLSPLAVSSATGVETLQIPIGTPFTTRMTVPEELLYAAAIHPELRTTLPFYVQFERTESGYAAVVHELDEYGLGCTRSEALEDLRKTLQELYLSLEHDESRLSEDLLSVWARLKNHVTRFHG